jgi:glycerol-3-phosphate dehydrogenase (NAD(P)+)
MKKPRNSGSLSVGVIGDGGWGTTLAILLARKGHRVSLWGAFPSYIRQIDAKRVNSRFLPGIRIPRDIEITCDLNRALSAKDAVVIAVPSQHLREVLKAVRSQGPCHAPVYVSVTKGLEVGTLKRMSEVIHAQLGNVKLAVLSGPTIAHEVALGMPTAAVAASNDPTVRHMVQDLFITERFRIYTSPDVVGVELGGSLKNIIAIACGIADGMGFGANAKAGILARGLAEIARLGHAMGAKARTFSGISGLGDLVTTCISPYSRNRFVGEELGKGRTIEQITGKMQMVAEGVPTAKSAYCLGRKFKVELPIINEVYKVIYQKKSAKSAFKDLMARERKEE